MSYSEKEHEDVITGIRDASLLKKGAGYTCMELQKEYREMTGTEVPFDRLGYRTFDDLLSSNSRYFVKQKGLWYGIPDPEQHEQLRTMNAGRGTRPVRNRGRGRGGGFGSGFQPQRAFQPPPNQSRNNFRPTASFQTPYGDEYSNPTMNDYKGRDNGNSGTSGNFGRNYDEYDDSASNKRSNFRYEDDYYGENKNSMQGGSYYNRPPGFGNDRNPPPGFSEYSRRPISPGYCGGSNRQATPPPGFSMDNDINREFRAGFGVDSPPRRESPRPTAFARDSYRDDTYSYPRPPEDRRGYDYDLSTDGSQSQESMDKENDMLVKRTIHFLRKIFPKDMSDLELGKILKNDHRGAGPLLDGKSGEEQAKIRLSIISRANTPTTPNDRLRIFVDKEKDKGLKFYSYIPNYNDRPGDAEKYLYDLACQLLKHHGKLTIGNLVSRLEVEKQPKLYEDAYLWEVLHEHNDDGCLIFSGEAPNKYVELRPGCKLPKFQLVDNKDEYNLPGSDEDGNGERYESEESDEEVREPPRPSFGTGGTGFAEDTAPPNNHFSRHSSSKPRQASPSRPTSSNFTENGRVSTMTADFIPHRLLTNFTPGKRESIYVANFADLSNFSVRLREDDDEYYNLKSKLKKAYSGAFPSFFHITLGVPSCIYDVTKNTMHRGIVLETFRKGAAFVELIDEGKIAFIENVRVAPLKPEFLELPCLALRCTTEEHAVKPNKEATFLEQESKLGADLKNGQKDGAIKLISKNENRVVVDLLLSTGEGDTSVRDMFIKSEMLLKEAI